MKGNVPCSKGRNFVLHWGNMNSWGRCTTACKINLWKYLPLLSLQGCETSNLRLMPLISMTIIFAGSWISAVVVLDGWLDLVIVKVFPEFNDSVILSECCFVVFVWFFLRSAQFLDILLFPSEVNLQAEIRGCGRSELPDVPIQVTRVLSLVWVADTLKKADHLSAYHSHNCGCGEGSAGIKSVIFVWAIWKCTLGYQQLITMKQQNKSKSPATPEGRLWLRPKCQHLPVVNFGGSFAELNPVCKATKDLGLRNEDSWGGAGCPSFLSVCCPEASFFHEGLSSWERKELWYPGSTSCSWAGEFEAQPDH